MPKYSYKLKNGKTMDLEGESMPSDEEVESIARENKVELALADEPETTVIKPEQFTPPKIETPKEPLLEVKPERGMLGNIWDKLSSPLTNIPSDIARSVTGSDTRHASMGMDTLLDVGKGLLNHPMETLKGGLEGSIEGLGELADSFTSPLSIATLGAGGLETGAVKAGLPRVAQVANIAQRMSGIPQAAHGATNLLSPDSSLSERGTGLLDIAIGASGFGNREKVPNILKKETPPVITKTEKPRYRLDSESGAYIPINKDGNQIGKAEFPGKTYVGPEGSKYDKVKIEDKSGMLQKIWDIPRGLMSVDLPFVTSAAFRQASPMVGTKEWFKSWIPAAQSYGSKDTYNKLMLDINNQPLFKTRKNTVTGETTPSFAQEAGLRLGDLTKYTGREEGIRSELTESIPLYGRHIAASNRAYTGFLNTLRSQKFTQLIDDATTQGLNPKQNIKLSKEIAEFVNTATGQGKLGIELGPTKRWAANVNLENSSRLLTNAFFSPRKIASEIRMLNPFTYSQASPVVRKEYAKAFARRLAMWGTISGLAKFGGAEVNSDPTNPDFGKIKIGKNRIDPPGGLQQFLVLGAQLAAGGKTSSNTGKFMPFGEGYKPETMLSDTTSFMANRMHPTPKAAYDLMSATASRPVGAMDRTVQMAAPMFASDFMEILDEEPWLIGAMLGASNIGMGTQSYGKGDFGQNKFIPKENDFIVGSRK